MMRKDKRRQDRTALQTKMRGAVRVLISRGWRQLSRFHRHALTNFLEHGGDTWQHNSNVRNHADVNVTLHDVERSDVDSAGFKANEIGKKNNTRATETFGADSENVFV